MNVKLTGDTNVMSIVGIPTLKSTRLKDNLMRVESENVTKSD